jgi:hypothetical protein
MYLVSNQLSVKSSYELRWARKSWWGYLEPASRVKAVDLLAFGNNFEEDSKGKLRR